MTQRQNQPAPAAPGLCAAAACVSPGKAADGVPPDTAKSLEIAEKSSNSETFRTTLQREIAANPHRRYAILRAVMRAHPAQSAALLMDGHHPSSSFADPGDGNDDAVTDPQTQTTGMSAALPQVIAEIVASATLEEEADREDFLERQLVLGTSVRSGNTDSPGVGGESSVSYEEDRWHHRATAAGDCLRNRTESQEQSFGGEYDVRYDLDSRDVTYGPVRYEADRSTGFDYAFTSSAGPGRHLVKEDGHAWTVTLGRSFRVAQRNDSESPEGSVGVRFTNRRGWELSLSAEVENETGGWPTARRCP